MPIDNSYRALQGTELYVGYMSGFTGAYYQGKTLDELNNNLLEVITMLLEDGKTTKSS